MEKEDDNGEAGRLVAWMNRVSSALACVCIITHHPSKNGPAKGMRGASAYLGNADFTLHVETDKTKTRELRVGKSRDGHADRSLGSFVLAPVTVGQSGDRENVQSCVVVFQPDTQVKAVKTAANFADLTAVLEMLSGGETAEEFGGKTFVPWAEVSKGFIDRVMKKGNGGEGLPQATAYDRLKKAKEYALTYGGYEVRCPDPLYPKREFISAEGASVFSATVLAG
jgi:hypothetical protein